MSSAARGTFEDDQDEEVDFYECQESLEPPDQRRKEDQETKQPVREKVDEKFERVTQIECKAGEGLVDKERSETGEGLVDKEQSGGQGGERDLECRGKEFDDDDLSEEETELTEEEEESRRQQSFILKEQGNVQFKAGDWSKAEQSYTAALRLCPVCFSQERAVLFSNRGAARLHLDLKDQAIADCSKAIELNPNYIRALLRRAELHEQTEKLDEALEDYKKVLDKDPNHAGARQACMRLPQQIHDRNEKLKEEMIGKLKDLGNMVLRPFGLSTNNFQVNQDSSTGGYSINFVQNPNGNNR
ncbi:tetratricopeptide repeat protein 1 [Thalassophryne amazonica]|uniref:tetratricopeptide repeat protein 1 n=1 Tax=Thalassophryne amazonica TaxID=390379 RepID=UPI00147198F2|nr:tetratricopeptide repeat protein 1 [Thalassophryne amazonica]